jgi:hypothetical protein
MVMDDTELLAAFESRALEAFPHRDHLRVAFALLRREGDVAAATGAFGAVLCGIPKYNEAITRAYVAIIADRMTTGTHASSQDFLAANADLLDVRVISRRP